MLLFYNLLLLFDIKKIKHTLYNLKGSRKVVQIYQSGTGPFQNILIINILLFKGKLIRSTYQHHSCIYFLELIGANLMDDNTLPK